MQKDTQDISEEDPKSLSFQYSDEIIKSLVEVIWFGQVMDIQ